MEKKCIRSITVDEMEDAVHSILIGMPILNRYIQSENTLNPLSPSV
jgi:hypothetical protein